MIKIIVGIFIGIVIATVGFSGVTKLLDSGVEQTKVIVKEQVEKVK